jgi:hypothetical protein
MDAINDANLQRESLLNLMAVNGEVCMSQPYDVGFMDGILRVRRVPQVFQSVCG